MQETTPGAAAPAAAPASRNPAVLRCCQARLRSLEESRAKRLNAYDSKKNAVAAYLDAMPDLSGAKNIRDFIACVAHGMLIGVIEAMDGTKLLYAAQIALGTLRRKPRDRKRPAA